MRSHPWLLAIAVAVFAACGGGEGSSVGPERTAGLVVTALASPVCPVVTDPPSPECAPRRVAAAEIAVTVPDGVELARVATGPDGKAAFSLTPGELVVIPQAVEGLPGTAPMLAVMLTAGQTMRVTANYDTGIR
jgi:hypothetical protein